MGKDRLLHPAAAQGKGREVMPPAIVVPAVQPIDYPRLLEAIAEVESGNRAHAVGRDGECGPLQFKETTWASLTNLPFDKAEYRSYAFPVAREYLMRARWRLLEAHFDPNPYNLALCWHLGLEGALNALILGKWTNKDVWEYPQRVCALYADR